MQGLRETLGILDDAFLRLRGQAALRVYGDGVAGVDTGTLDMLHDARDQDVLTVADRIDLELGTTDVLIDEDRVLLCDLVDLADVLVDILIADRDTHAGTTEYVGRTYQYRVAQHMGRFLRFLCRKYGLTCGTLATGLLENLIETLTVLCGIDVVLLGSEDRYTHLLEGIGQLDSGLSTELNDRSVRLLHIYNVPYIFRCQRLEVELIRDIEVRGNGLRVIVDDDGLIALTLELPCTVYRAEIELDTLADTDRAGAEDEYLLFLVRIAEGTGRLVL